MPTSRSIPMEKTMMLSPRRELQGRVLCIRGYVEGIERTIRVVSAIHEDPSLSIHTPAHPTISHGCC